MKDLVNTGESHYCTGDYKFLIIPYKKKNPKYLEIWDIE